jgi:23S rRNA (cytosine1962-C5)-methyltransferase
MSSLCLLACPPRAIRALVPAVISDRAWLKPAQLAAFAAAQTTAHRICTTPDGWVERLGDDALICYKHEAESFMDGLSEWSVSAGWLPQRVFGKLLPRHNEDRSAPVLLSGPEGCLHTVVMEAGVRYGIDFAAGYSHGFFLDQRANRSFVRRIKPRRMLNTFAYTCSFSVVAALAGAETVNVDLSKKSLDRGRENFEFNSLNPAAGHRFIADDVLDVLPRLARRGDTFDAIILDPPTFSRGNQGRRWQVEQHFEDLVAAALELASPGCRLLLSTNCAKLEPRALERMARYCLKVQRRAAEFHREGALVDFPPGHGASTLWMAVK